VKKTKKKVHSSWLIAWFSSAFLIGVAVSPVLPEYARLPILISLIFAVSIAFCIRTKSSVVLIVISGVLFGLFRGGLSQAANDEYQQFFNEQKITMEGVVSEDASITAQGNQQLKLKDIRVNGQNLEGKIWVSTASLTQLKRSDSVIFKGKLKEGFGSFQASMYRAELVEVIHVANADLPREMRDSFADKVRKVISEPQASLGLGYLLGQRTALPEEMINNLKILGLTHIVVASGYNLTILVRFTRRIFANISKYLSLISGLALTIGFVLVTGFSPSMTRAALITSLCLVAWYFGRSIHPFVLLSFSAAVTTLINPSYVWGDLGWYLSFAAFGGVIVLSPLIINYFWGNKRPNSLVQILVETSSAQIVTIPIIAYSFSQIAPLALISNILILPLVPIAMITTFIAGLSAVMFGADALVLLIAKPAQFILSYMTTVVDRLSLIPIAKAEVNFGLVALIASYVIIIFVIVFLIRRTKHDFLEDNVIL